MSLGFSLGDFIAVAQLAYQLSKMLSESKGAAEEYRTLITELDVVHRVLLQVNDLRASNQLSQATVNALLFTVNSTRELIGSFLDSHSAYSSSLKPGGSGNPIKDMLIKGSVELRPRMGRPTQWKDIRTFGSIYSTATALDQVWIKEFEMQKKPISFFRPGQIFAAQITSRLSFENKRAFRKVDFGNLPLAPIPKLKAVADREQLEDMIKRLTQIRQLPLDRMTRYCRDIPGDRKSVQCLLCGQNSRILQDYWATQHFRACHKEYYFGLKQDENSANLKVIPWKKQLKKLPHSTSTEFSAEKWIVLEDITIDVPIQEDWDFSGWDISQQYYLDVGGPIMIQRFVVVREDNKCCLCLGIHTYMKQGCGNQSDQELHGVLSSEKSPPPLAPNETKVILSPVRMKPDHPSLALSNTARIHYGRAYEISHAIPVQPLGLIHPASMEVLINQFEANVTRLQPGEDLGDEWEEDMPENINSQQKVEDVTPSIKGAYTRRNIVKDMRRSMKKVLGPKLPPPSGMYHVRDEHFDERRIL
ncbi:uncharacterized protein Triagg1_5078 [Trichoderma aggressivum f. europaeum]|uniref:DUF6590 domain-containing protein n=1 Tax=Trichoderma aggressivum f. europaeum TaxID=173218 RepID=A0AAE1IGV7_9HYPO|nr:hypothetical protein Triagg1_5078 [Trichoderma aggressivum f. europaeum]